MEELKNLLQSEKAVLDTLKLRLKAVEHTRVPTLILSGSGSIEERLGILLRKLAQDLNGLYCDLTSPEAIDRLKKGPPFYGRSMDVYLTAEAVRQFLLRECSLFCTHTLAVHIPGTIWKLMSNAHPSEPLTFLTGLCEWTSPCNLVLSYPYGVDWSIPSLEEVPNLPTHRVVELVLTNAERCYLEGEWEKTFHDR